MDVMLLRQIVRDLLHHQFMKALVEVHQRNLVIRVDHLTISALPRQPDPKTGIPLIEERIEINNYHAQQFGVTNHRDPILSPIFFMALHTLCKAEGINLTSNGFEIMSEQSRTIGDRFRSLVLLK